MAPSILIVGATGNTGPKVVETLPKLLQESNSDLHSHRILALTRSLESAGAKHLSSIPGIELLEYNWTNITQDWLQDHAVTRVFIASHNMPTQFADEGQFLTNALRAGVRYVVRISTTAANVHPDFPAYYPRTHWAIETMLSQPEFSDLHWSSLQPNGFTGMFIGNAAEFVREFRTTGSQGGRALSMIIDAGTPTGLVDAGDVGVVAAHLLAQRDTGPHNGKRYVVNGPEDVTGEQVVKMVEQYIGEKVENVKFKDVAFIDKMAEGNPASKNLMLSIKQAPVTSWEGKAKAETTSQEILELCPPKRTVAEVFKDLVEG